jgi:hypothetical protein
LDFDFSFGLIPQKGDTLHIVTYNSIESDDVFQFTANKNYILSNKDEAITPDKFLLNQKYPSPFNPTTTIKYTIHSNAKSGIAHVKLAVYDIFGREIEVIIDEPQNIGNYEIIFNASNITSGVCFYTLSCGKFSITKKYYYCNEMQINRTPLFIRVWCVIKFYRKNNIAI